MDVSTTDFETAVGYLQKMYGDLQARLDGPFEWSTRASLLGPMTVVRGFCSASVALAGTPRAHLVVTTHSGLMRTSSDLAVAPGRRAMCLSPGRHLAWQASAAIETLTVRIDPAFLRLQLEALTGASVGGAIVFDQALRLDTDVGALVERLFGFLARGSGGEGACHPVLASTLQASLAQLLLTRHSHSLSHLLSASGASAGEAIVRLVEGYVDAHAEGPILSDALVAVAQASLPAIKAAFDRHRGMTPTAFIRQRRLAAVRRRLLEGPHEPMQRAVQAAGFLNYAPFETAYQKAFGETPASTRARGRAPVPTHRGDTLEACAGRVPLLSPRELEVCGLVASGWLNKQIAPALGITERTVKAHRARAMTKLGIGSAAELGRLWERMGW